MSIQTEFNKHFSLPKGVKVNTDTNPDEKKRKKNQLKRR